MPDILVTAIDALPALRSFHILSCYPDELTAMPLLGCLTALSSISLTNATLPCFPTQLAQLVRCSRIDLSDSKFASLAGVEEVLKAMTAAALGTEGGVAEREIWLSDNWKLKGRIDASGGGIRARLVPFLRGLGAERIMSNDDFRTDVDDFS